MNRFRKFFFLWISAYVLPIAVCLTIMACGDRAENGQRPSPVFTSVGGDMQLDPVTGIPYATTFQVPVVGLAASDFCFGFGAVNTNFCLKSGPNGCEAYGYHLGQDSCVAKTPVGAEIVAPADGIVRITTDVKFSGYGSDSASNPDYKGCALTLEHEFSNGQHVTSILGHVKCEADVTYDPVAKKGNPKVGTLVKRGQYLGHVGHYWHGKDQSADWHHLHWGMRLGAFSASSYTASALAPYVRGYAPKSEFTYNSLAKAFTHPEWVDPLVVLAANGDPAVQASADVKRHPPGTLLVGPDGSYWIVLDEKTIALVPSDVFASDRYDPASAAHVTFDELGCYAKAPNASSLGKAWLYVRPGTNTVVIAYEKTKERYDFIRWEALLSWGFSAGDISADAGLISFIEKTYVPKGFRLLRPGTRVKADEEPEVSSVTVAQTRRPIVSGEVFEKLNFSWKLVVSVPKSVIDAVAGPRENAMIDFAYIQTCAAPATSGGGGNPVCNPGETVSCLCLTGSVGSQVCAPDGLSYESCVCPSQSSGGSGGTGGASNSGGSAGTGGSPSGGATSNSGGATSYGGTTSSGGTQSNGGTPSSGGTSSNGGTGGSGSASDGGSQANAPPHFFFKSPVAGPLYIAGWWKKADGTIVSWHTITECADVNPADDILECDLPVPSGAPYFEFQVYLPNGKFWGDQACGSGGCYQPLGQLILTQGGDPVSYAFKPNQSGAPYYNGVVAPVP